VFKYAIGNYPGISYKWCVFGVERSNQKSRFGLRLTAIRSGFDLYECPLVICSHLLTSLHQQQAFIVLFIRDGLENAAGELTEWRLLVDYAVWDVEYGSVERIMISRRRLEASALMEWTGAASVNSSFADLFRSKSRSPATGDNMVVSFGPWNDIIYEIFTFISRRPTGWRKKLGHLISLQIFWKFHDRIAWKLMIFCNSLLYAEHGH